MTPFRSNDSKDHILSSIDGRVKLIAALVVLMMVLSYRGFVFPVIVTTACLLLCRGMQIPLRTLLLRFAEPLFLVIVVLLLKLFFSGHEALFSLNIFGAEIIGHRDGLHEGLIIGARIVGAVSVVAVLGFATPFSELLTGLSWLRVPKGFVEILVFAYRYVFVLFEDALVIYQAQKNRLGYSNVKRGMSSFGTLAGSLTIRAFDHSQNTSVAMVQRGYDGTLPIATHRPFKFSEIALSACSLLVMGAVWLLV